MINNTITGNLKYHGIVKISVLKGNKLIKTIKTHNAGTTWLFQILSSMLCGNDERLNVPRYFDLGNLTQATEYSSQIFESSIANRVSLSSKVIKNFKVSEGSTIFTGSYGASFTALIPSLQIISSTAKQLRLYSTKNGGDEVLLAQVDLPETIQLEETSGYNYMIEWVMLFENALTETNNSTAI